MLRVFEEEATLDDDVFEQLAEAVADALEGRAPWTNSSSSGGGDGGSGANTNNQDASALRAMRQCAALIRRRNTTTALPYGDEYANASTDSAITLPADLSAARDNDDYEGALSSELVEELKDAFHVVSLPLPVPPPLRHRSSFSASAGCGLAASPTASATSPPLTPNARRRTHTVDAAVRLRFSSSSPQSASHETSHAIAKPL